MIKQLKVMCSSALRVVLFQTSFSLVFTLDHHERPADTHSKQQPDEKKTTQLHYYLPLGKAKATGDLDQRRPAPGSQASECAQL